MSFLIAKAGPRRPWKATRTPRRIEALGNQMGKAMGISLRDGLTAFKGRVDPKKVYDAWLTGDYHKVMTALPWERLHADIDPAMEPFTGASRGAWNMELERLPPPARHLRWDLTNPRIRELINSRRAYNFTNLSESSATNIRHWVKSSFDRALKPNQVAAGIRDQIGLLPAHAQAVANLRVNLLNDGSSPEHADKLAGEYANRLLDYRANMIGRTETRLATNQGQLTVWRQAADQGLIDRASTGKSWITMGPDPCEICEPMDGKTVPLDSFWTLPDGSTCDCPPDGSHPHCFCGMEIVYDIPKSEED